MWDKVYNLFELLKQSTLIFHRKLCVSYLIKTWQKSVYLPNNDKTICPTYQSLHYLKARKDNKDRQTFGYTEIYDLGQEVLMALSKCV